MASIERNRRERTRRKRSFAVRGDFLRSLRFARGWTQKEVAARIDVTDRLVRKAESGGPLEIKTITRLAVLYGSDDSPLNPENLLAEADALAREPAPKRAMTENLHRLFHAMWNELDLAVIDELVAPEIIYHAEQGPVRSREEMKQRILKLRESFGIIELVVEELLDLGDAILCRWRAVMTHTGAWLDLAPTGRSVVVHGSTWVQVIGDKFGDGWDFWDPGLLYEQLKEPQSGEQRQASYHPQKS